MAKRTTYSSASTKYYLTRDDLVNLTGPDKVKECLKTYRTVGLCKNIIDMMSDFASEGIAFKHKDKTQEEFWKAWGDKIELFDRTERYINNILKAGFLVIKKNYGSLTLRPPYSDKETKQRVPTSYRFINPEQIELYGSKQEGSVIAIFKIPQSSSANQEIRKQLDKNLSPEIKKARAQGKDNVLLDPKTTHIDFYKCDDWQTYPDALHYAILPDLHFYEKMRQMDIATMEGVINVIRLWKLGTVLPNGVIKMPEPATVQKLKDMLDEKIGGGVSDLLWDSMIDLEEHYPPVEKILGSEKYQYVKEEIKEGFGIPDILITGKGQGSYSNQFLGIKVLIERLEYVREKVRRWIMNEVYEIMELYGWTDPPIVRFEYMNLRDEATVQKLLIQLIDRNIVSKDTLLKRFNEIWPMEQNIIDEEKLEEKSNEAIKRITPYNDQNEDNKSTPSDGFNNPSNGRPTDSKQEQEVQRDTKPQGS